MHTHPLPFWVLDQWVQPFSQRKQGAGGCRKFQHPMFFVGRSDVDGGVSSPLPGKYHVNDFFLGCFNVFWHRFAPCSLLTTATLYYIQILYGNCFTDIRCFFFALFVTPKASFDQLDMSTSLTDHWWIVCIPEDSSATLWPLSYHPHACTPLHCILCSQCYHTIPVLLYLYIVCWSGKYFTLHRGVTCLSIEKLWLYHRKASTNKIN